MNTHQVVFLLLDLAVVIVLARLLGALAGRLGQPPVIGEVLAGILLGPTLFGETFAATLFPTDVRPFLAALANVGIAMFMFVVGLELERTLLRGRGRIAVTVSVSSIVLPFVMGGGLAFYLLVNHPAEHRLGFVLFVGAAMSVTAFPVLARILADRGMLRTSLGGLTLTCAAVGDVLAWTLLAVVVTISGNGGAQSWPILLFPVYVVVMVWGVRPLLRRVFTGDTELRAGRLVTVLAGVLMSGAITEAIGLHFIFGAFLFGVVMAEVGGEWLRRALRQRVEEFNSALLLPVFFVVAGLEVDLSGIGSVGLVELGLVLVVAVAGKFGGTFVGARLHGLPARQCGALATLMNTRGLTELIILSVGLRFGILDESLYSIMVAMAVITTAMTGPLLRLIYPWAMVERDEARATSRSTGRPVRPAPAE